MPRIAPDLDGVEATMLITLWARAAETERPNGLLNDPEAVRLRYAVDYDFSRFDGAWKTQVGVAVRTRWLDRAVVRFLEAHPHGLVVNLGAGLDTRPARLDNGTGRWLTVDTPPALAFRSRCLPRLPREDVLAGSALDDGWLAHAVATGGPVLVLAEGVLMFLPERGVQELVRRTAERLPEATMLFDVIGGLMVRFPFLHDTLPSSGVRFAWGIGRRPAARMRAWSGGRADARMHCLLDESPARWRWMQAIRPLPYFRRQFAIAELRVRAENPAAKPLRPGGGD